MVHTSTLPSLPDDHPPENSRAAVRHLAQPVQDTVVAADDLIAIFDGLSDTVFFLKNVSGQYTHVNQTMASRLGLAHRGDAIGYTAAELYPPIMGASYVEQDRRVLQGGVIENLLELQLFPNRAPGWCLTHKRPLRECGAIRGLVGISRDLGRQPNHGPIYARLRVAVDTIQRHYTENLRVGAVAHDAGMPMLQMERYFKRVFRLTPQQMLTKLRIERATQLLRGTDNVARISQACGFADHSAFTRQFRTTVGVTPRAYRAMLLGRLLCAHQPR